MQQQFQGSQTINGLSAGTIYYFYPYVDDSSGQDNAIVTMVASGGVGLPSWAQPFTSSGLAQIAAAGPHISLSSSAMIAATAVSGSGGGIGGGRYFR